MVRAAGRRRRLTPTQQWLEEDAKRKREAGEKTAEQRRQRAARAAARAGRALSPLPPPSPLLATARAPSIHSPHRHDGLCGDGLPGDSARDSLASRSSASLLQQDADDGQDMRDGQGMDMSDDGAPNGNAVSTAPDASPGVSNPSSARPAAQSPPLPQQPHGSVGASVSSSGGAGGAGTAVGSAVAGSGVRQAGAVADVDGMGPVDPSSPGQVAHSARAAVGRVRAGGRVRQDHVVQFPVGLFVHQAAKARDIRDWYVPARILMSLYHASPAGPATKATLVPLTRKLYRARKEMSEFDKKMRILERLPGLVAMEGAGRDKTWRLGPRVSEYGVDRATQLALLVDIQVEDARAAAQ